MRLKFITLEKVVNASYFSGIDLTPVFVLIVAPPGSGKTWSTSSISQLDFVQYLSGVYSPNEHRKTIVKLAARTRLLINDDLGLAARWNQDEYYATFNMMYGGELEYSQFNSTTRSRVNSSVILCCTTDYFYKHQDSMRGCGLLDRYVPLVLRLSNEKRFEFQRYQKEHSIFDNGPVQRKPHLSVTKVDRAELLIEKDVDPRMFRNVARISQYLSEEETLELIDVAHSAGKYEL